MNEINSIPASEIPHETIVLETADNLSPNSAPGYRKELWNVGAVVIGRNEGARLVRCLESVLGSTRQVVYVDSNSNDGSVDRARAMGAAVVELDMRIPFSAGRARNEGFQRLRQLAPDIDYVQFVDGDCEVVPGWFEKAAAFLDAHADVAAVAGRRRERYPERSVYNMLCAREWATHPVGEATTFAGDVLLRADVFEALNGYRPDLMAGEEPELGVRMHAAGWRIWFLRDELTLHDAAMLRFGQWWKRAMRSGYGCLQVAFLHGRPPKYYGIRESIAVWFWALALPACTFALVPAAGVLALGVLLLYPLHIVGIAARGAWWERDTWWEAVFLVLSPFPKLLGQLKYLTHVCLGGKVRLIDYKS